jgi:DNA mismatch repair protein MutL
MSSNPTIRLLPDQIINKIAAGEVVDRPASVVKELMENALDAGARSIEVAVVDGGVKLISIADDGHGMDRDNALMAVERHATSKIRDVDDVERVATLGFRGEALAAIASVSRFTLRTRRREDTGGTEVRIHGGRMEEVTDAGGPPGTTIEVRQLFYNVPARRKFLKTAVTETNQVRHVFLLYALGRPDIALRLVVDEREVYRLDGDAQIEDRIRQIQGADTLRALLPVDWSHPAGWRIYGLISSPRLHRADRTEQYVFINRRPASAPVIGYAINEAYQEQLPKGRYPLVFLFLEMPPEEVDVNVHPTKKEVRFRRSAQVRDALITALREALAPKASGEGGAVTPAGPAASGPSATGSPEVREFLRVPDLPVLPAFNYPKKPGVEPVGAPEGAGATSPPVEEARTTPMSRAPWRWCRVLGQIADFFVVLETDEGMILMDPQAAHERVLFEKLMRAAKKRSVSTQGLLTPETVTLPPLRSGLIAKHLPVLRELGFGIEPFGGDTFIVDALPVALDHVAAAALLLDIAEELEMTGRSGASASPVREQVLQAVARSAVQSTTRLSREALEQLIADLALADLPYTSPRGRPTLIFTSLQEMRKKFGRS